MSNNIAQQAEVEVDTNTVPVKIEDGDLKRLDTIQKHVDRLAKYRQEIGRLFQLLGNIREEANAVEMELATSRKELSDKYELEKKGPGQWALDFEHKEFVKTAATAPVIP